ncbi:MAG: hypothetical protein WCO13_12385 [Bacteroidota bacterium]
MNDTIKSEHYFPIKCNFDRFLIITLSIITLTLFIIILKQSSEIKQLKSSIGIQNSQTISLQVGLNDLEMKVSDLEEKISNLEDRVSY